MRHIPTPTPIDDDEIAAALAAVRCYIEPAQPDRAAEPPRRAAWHSAGMLEAQGRPPVYHRAQSSWGSVDRAVRAHHWSYGIIDV
jgi:hypothetical protein